MRLIDFSAKKIDPQAIKAAGYAGVIAYVSRSRPGSNFGAKPLTREYADQLRAAGLHVVSNWQYGKPGNPQAPSDYTRGFAGGVADAREALRIHAEAGGPDSAPIYFSVDEGIDLRTWNKVAAEWFRGINSVVGVARTGIYGSSLVCAWAIEDGLIGRSKDAGKFYAWQTKAWSNGARTEGAALYQGVVDTASTPGPLVGGVRTDVNDVLATDFGQWGAAGEVPPVTEGGSQVGWKGDPVWLADVLRAEGLNVVEFDGWKNRGHGDFRDIWGVMAHHTGASKASAASIAHGHPGLQGPLSQIHLAQDGTVTVVAVGVAWHAGAGRYPGLPNNDANWHTIGIEAAHNGTEPWKPAQYEAYVKVCAALCRRLGYGADRVIAHKEWAGNPHFDGTPGQGKWDPGNMDYGRFRADIQAQINNKPGEVRPPVNEDFAEPGRSADDIVRKELSYKFKSRVDGSHFRDTLIGYTLENDRKLYNMEQSHKSLHAKLDALLEALGEK